MSDFHQTGVISTLHRFHTSSVEYLDGQLVEFASKRPITLVLPSTYSDVKREAMQRIVEELRPVRYLRQVVISLCGADRAGFDHTADLLQELPGKVRIVWNSGERIRHLCERLDENGLTIGPVGKGRAVWMALGYVLADEKNYLVALHDCGNDRSQQQEQRAGQAMDQTDRGAGNSDEIHRAPGLHRKGLLWRGGRMLTKRPAVRRLELSALRSGPRETSPFSAR